MTLFPTPPLRLWFPLKRFPTQGVIYCPRKAGPSGHLGNVGRLPPGGAALGRLPVVHHPRAAGLRRALGAVAVAALCVSAVTLYRDAPELPRSAPADADGPPSLTSPAPTAQASSASQSPTPSPTATRTTTATKAKLPKGPAT